MAATSEFTQSQWFRHVWHVLLVAMLLALQACASSRYASDDGKNREADSNLDFSRAGPVPTTRDSLEVVNLLELLDPSGAAERGFVAQNSQQEWNRLPFASKYDIALSFFRASHKTTGLSEQRNLVQQRLMIASERRCNRFTQFLRSDASNTNYAFGAVSGVLSTFGALVGGRPEDAKRLSGLSALTSGLRAEYNNEYYSNLATHVIVRGIEEKRRELREQIQQRQRSDYASYDIGTAILDAVQFDGSCDIVNGLKTADEALARLREPGRAAINNALIQNELTRALAQGTPEDVQKWRDKVTTLSLDASSLARNSTVGGSGGAAGDLNPLSPLLEIARFKVEAGAINKAWIAQAIAALREQAGSKNSALLVTSTLTMTSSLTVSVVVTEPGSSATKTVSQSTVTTTVSVGSTSLADLAEMQIGSLTKALTAAVESAADKGCGKDADSIQEAVQSALAAGVKAGTDDVKRRVANDAIAAAQERSERFSLRIQRHLEVLRGLRALHADALSKAATGAQGKSMDLLSIWRAGDIWLKLSTAQQRIGDTLLCK